MTSNIKNPICDNREGYDETQLAAAGCDTSYQAQDTVINLLNPITGIAGILAVIFIIYGGFQYMTAGGNTSKIASAKTIILYSVIGLIVVMLAWSIVALVVNQLD